MKKKFIINTSMLRMLFVAKAAPQNVYCPAVNMKGSHIGRITNTQLAAFTRVVSSQTHEVLITV